MDPAAITRCLQQYRNLHAHNEAQKRAGGHDYSLIASLLKPADEVNLHSRFLYSMLDPEGLHYRGPAFLECFLNTLPPELQNFITAKSVHLHREEGRIDLLIEDGERALIIENKINAKDQPNQITRYIRHVQKMLGLERDELPDRVAVIYLSARRSKPEAGSHGGFRLHEGWLYWEPACSPGLPEDPPDLNPGARIPFHHLPYFSSSRSLDSWAKRCMDEAPPGGIRYAFEEYRLVLERLRKPRSWRKVMNLADYAMTLAGQEQEDLYAFMVEAQKALDRFIVDKLYAGLREMFGDEVLAQRGPFQPFSKKSLRGWLKMPPKPGEEIGFTFEVPGDGMFGFVLGKQYAYLGPTSQLPFWGKEHLRIEGIAARQLLREWNDGVFRLLNGIRKAARRSDAPANAPGDSRETARS